MSTEQSELEGKVISHLSALTGAVDQSDVFASIKPNVDRAAQAFSHHNLESLQSGKNLETAFMNAAAAYMHGLTGVGYDEPLQPAILMKDWLNKVSDSALAEAMQYLRRGDRTKVAELFKSAYETHISSGKTQSAVADKTNQTPEVQTAMDTALAKLLSMNGQIVQPYEVGSNYSAAVRAFAQMYNASKSLKKG